MSLFSINTFGDGPACKAGTSAKCLVSVQGRPQGGGQMGHFAPGPLNTCLKDRYTLIEQSDLNTLIEQSQYSSEEQCSKLIDKEIWLVMGSYCHCQQVVTFFFFFFFFGLHLTTWVKGPTLTLCPGPLNFSGQPCFCVQH